MPSFRTKLTKISSASLILLIIFSVLPVTTSAYPQYSGNSNTIVAGPADGATAGTGNVGGIPSSREFLTVEQRYRIRQTGLITSVRFYTSTTSGLTAFYVKIWRKNGSNYDLVTTSENLLGGMTSATTSTIALNTPLSVQEGDFIGYRIEGSGSAYNLYAIGGQFGGTYYVSNAVPSTTNYNWAGNSYLNAQVVPIEVHMTAPQAVFIGDSIIAGHPGHYSFLEGSSSTTNIASTIEKQFSNLTGYTYQNMGIGSQVTAQLAARFNAHVIALKPKIVIIEGGVNDIAGAVSKSTFLASWTSMLNAAQADSGITSIVVLKILPWTSGSNANMQIRDDWNASLATLAAGYSKAIVVDASSYVGQFRAGGDADNLWNQQAAYNSGDNIHFNAAGHGQIAQAIADALPTPTATFDNDFPTWNSGNVTVNYNLIQTGGSSTTNLSQTSTSGIEYSRDGVSWSDATKGTGGDAVTGLTSSAAPGTDHVFMWDSATDLPGVEDSTVYLRIRPNDGTTSATGWITSNAFGLDNAAPSGVGAPSFGTISTSSIEVIKPSTVNENGAGLYQWQARRSGTNSLGFNGIGTASIVDTGLSANTQYAYDAQFNDAKSNLSSYGTAVNRYTLAPAPTNLYGTSAQKTVDLSVDPFPNSTSGQSGYFFSRTGGSSSGWIQANSWQDTDLLCGTSYTYSVKYRNGDGIETSTITTTVATSNCPSNGIIFNPTACSAVSYGEWGMCVSGTQYRNLLNQVPANCTLTASQQAVRSRSCSDNSLPVTPSNSETPPAPQPLPPFETVYKDGTLLRGEDARIYVVINQKLKYVSNLKELTQYKGPIIQVSNTVIQAFPKATTVETAKFLFTRNFSLGDIHPDIKELQKYLNAKGFFIAKTGAGSPNKETSFFGEATRRALINLQIAKNIIPTTGFFGPLTRAFINNQ